MSRELGIASQSEREFSVLQIQLRKLVIEGKGNENEADEVRDHMDVYWSQMTPEELQRARTLSYDLADVLPGRPLPAPRLADESWRNEFELAMELAWQGRPDKALALLRDPRAASPEIAGLLCLRGRVWEAAGFMEAALEFILAAETANPRMYSGLLIDLARRMGHWELALSRALPVLSGQSDNPITNFFAAVTVLGARERTHVVSKHALSSVIRKLSQYIPPRADIADNDIYAGVAVVLGSAYELSSQYSDAVRVYGDFIKRNPNAGDFYSFRGLAHLRAAEGTGALTLPKAALEDFQQAVSLGTKWGWAYAAVAQDKIIQGKAAEALVFCNTALDKQLPPKESQAALFECRAIAKTVLNQSREPIVEDYHAVKRLFPSYSPPSYFLDENATEPQGSLKVEATIRLGAHTYNDFDERVESYNSRIMGLSAA